MAYATKTEVPVQRTISELDALLGKYGATQFAFGRDDDERTSRVMFRIDGRVCKFEVERPTWEQHRLTNNGQWRDRTRAQAAADAEYRRRWRVRYLFIKALLVAVDEDATSLTDAFLPYLVLPSGQTMSEWAEPQLAVIGHQMPPVMPGVRQAIEQ